MRDFLWTDQTERLQDYSEPVDHNNYEILWKAIWQQRRERLRHAGEVMFWAGICWIIVLLASYGAYRLIAG